MTCSNYPSKLEPSSDRSRKKLVIRLCEKSILRYVGVPKLTAVMVNCQLFPLFTEPTSQFSGSYLQNSANWNFATKNI